MRWSAGYFAVLIGLILVVGSGCREIATENTDRNRAPETYLSVVTMHGTTFGGQASISALRRKVVVSPLATVTMPIFQPALNFYCSKMTVGGQVALRNDHGLPTGSHHGLDQLVDGVIDDIGRFAVVGRHEATLDEASGIDERFLHHEQLDPALGGQVPHLGDATGESPAAPRSAVRWRWLSR